MLAGVGVVAGRGVGEVQAEFERLLEHIGDDAV